MTDFGASPTGFIRKRFEDILESISQRQLKSISNQLATKSAKSVIGNVNQIFADELSVAWEALEAAYYGFDPKNAIDYLLTALCALSGVARLTPQPGQVDTTIEVDQAVTYLPGAMVAHVAGQTDNEWRNRDTFTTPVAGTFTGVPFVSLIVGSKAVAAAGTLTEISQPLTGWISITNPADAIPGRELETFEELRLRREASPSSAGSATLGSIVADLETVPGVVSVRGAENVQDFPTGGLPAHSIRITCYAPSVGDLAIAQRLHDAKWPGGIDSAGNTTVSNVKDVNGQFETFRFQRATAVPITIDVTVVSALGFDGAVVKQAVADANPSAIAVSVLIAKIIAATIAQKGIDNVTAVTLNRGGGPVSTDLPMSAIELATFDVADITVHT